MLIALSMIFVNAAYTLKFLIVTENSSGTAAMIFKTLCT